LCKCSSLVTVLYSLHPREGTPGCEIHMSSVFDWTAENAGVWIATLEDKREGLEAKLAVHRGVEELVKLTQQLDTANSAFEQARQQTEAAETRLRDEEAKRDSAWLGFRFSEQVRIQQTHCSNCIRNQQQTERRRDDAHRSRSAAANSVQVAKGIIRDLQHKYRAQSDVAAALAQSWKDKKDSKALSKVIEQLQIIQDLGRKQRLQSSLATDRQRVSNVELPARDARNRVVAAQQKDWQSFFGLGPNQSTQQAMRELESRSFTLQSAQSCLNSTERQLSATEHSVQSAQHAYNMRYERKDYCKKCDFAPCQRCEECEKCRGRCICCQDCGHSPCVCCPHCGQDPCQCRDPCSSCGQDPCSCCSSCGQDPCQCYDDRDDQYDDGDNYY